MSERLDKARRNNAEGDLLRTFYDNARKNGNPHESAFVALADFVLGRVDLQEREAARQVADARLEGYRDGWQDGYRSKDGEYA